MILSSDPIDVTLISDIAPISSKEFLDIQATIEHGRLIEKGWQLIQPF